MSNIYLGLMIFVAAIILYRIFSWRWEDAKREALMEEESHQWRITLISIAEAALKYRRWSVVVERRADARTLDNLLAQYNKLKEKR